MTTDGPPAVAVVVVCHDNAAEIAETLRALRRQLRTGDEVVVVDNASADGTQAVARAADPDATVVVPGENLGFAGGCHEGAGASSAPLLLFVNPDALPAPGFVAAMRAAAVGHPSWGPWQGLVTLPGGEIVNTAGNLVHWLGFGWAGGMGRRVARVAGDDREVPFASGAALAVRRRAWDAVGGFDRRYFMYGEDLDLSLRLRLAGWRIGVVPRARVAHEYTFAKGDYKWFYLERNRWWTLLAAYPGPLLAITLPALLAFEGALLIAAWRGGWLNAKLRAQAAVLRALPAMLRRRREVQATRTIAPAEFAAWLTSSLDSPYLDGARRLPGLPGAQAGFWRLARAALR
jgi:N-acetylglucosaminyl-diphospho-decaprenol L-rhamnosyltransferase